MLKLLEFIVSISWPEKTISNMFKKSLMSWSPQWSSTREKMPISSVTWPNFSLDTVEEEMLSYKEHYQCWMKLSSFSLKMLTTIQRSLIKNACLESFPQPIKSIRRHHPTMRPIRLHSMVWSTAKSNKIILKTQVSNLNFWWRLVRIKQKHPTMPI